VGAFITRIFFLNNFAPLRYLPVGEHFAGEPRLISGCGFRAFWAEKAA